MNKQIAIVFAALLVLPMTGLTSVAFASTNQPVCVEGTGKVSARVIFHKVENRFKGNSTATVFLGDGTTRGSGQSFDVMTNGQFITDSAPLDVPGASLTRK